MKTLFFLALALGLLVVAPRASHAQSQPVLSVAIQKLYAGAGISSDLGQVNEAALDWQTGITIEAMATGTSPAKGFTYSFFINGTAIGVSANNDGNPSIPGRVYWKPPAPGVYYLTVTAEDGSSPKVTSLPVRFFATGTVMTSPQSPTLVPSGSYVVLKADSTVANGFITKIDFYDGSTLIGSDETYPYSLIFAPTGSSGTHTITSVATVSTGTTSNSANTVVLRMTPSTGVMPTVSVTSPAADTPVRIPDYTEDSGANIPVSVTANDADGLISKVEIYIDGALAATDQQFPYAYSWKPQATGTYRIVALAYDDKNNVAASSPRVVTVTAPPTVAINSPVTGVSLPAGVPVQISASASDSDGSIAHVQFYVDGVLLSKVTSPSSGQSVYTTVWSPARKTDSTATKLTALATDNNGITTTSEVVAVTVTTSSTSSSDTVYSGTYFAGSETGRITLINTGTSAVAIGHTLSGTPRVYFYDGMEVDSGGSFTLTGSTVVSGRFTPTGATGTFDGTRATFIAPLLSGSGTVSNLGGLYLGSVADRASSILVGIVARDGTFVVYVADGSYRDAGTGTVTSAGAFSITLASGAKISGTVNPGSRFLSATLTGGAVTGAVTAASVSGLSASDGVLKNLSTRAQAGSGDGSMVAGFTIGGSQAKQILIRAIGPTLSSFGLSGVLANPKLELYQGDTLLRENDDWGGATALVDASSKVGAFTLSASSPEAVILTTLAPGGYTAKISGVGGGTGISLVEVYDVDAVDLFSTQKVMNLSTRASVGVGERAMVAGFVVSGNVAKKVLVRAVGPTLTKFGVGGVLADPYLRIRQGSTTVRENDNWEVGNNAALVSEASAKVGAFALPAGSKDAVILFTLPPGTYTAEVTGVGNTTGVAIVEVYEIP